MGQTANGRLRKPVWMWICLILILTLAAALRFHRLEAQSFWNDEGNSARIAERSIQLILEGAAGDIHPPLYYLGLHAWRAGMGQSEFALRAFSAVGGLWLVALIFSLGAHLFNRPAGLAAAFLAAINPFQVYYSQEARSYIWVAFLAAAAVYCGSRIQQTLFAPSTAGARSSSSMTRFSIPWSAGYVLSVAAGLFTHYLFLVVLIPINLIALIRLVSQARRESDRRTIFGSLGYWVLLHLLAFVLYLPWVQTAFRQLTSWPSTAGEAALGPALMEIFHLLSLGTTIDLADSAIALLGFGLLLLLGLIPRLPAEKVVNLLLTVLWLTIPVALILALDLYKPAFLKFLLIVSPVYCLLLGRGLTRFLLPVTRFTRVIVFPLALSLGLVLSFTYESLHNLYHDPNYSRADYRGMAQYIESIARPGDAVILNAANQWEVFTYYYDHVERVYPLPRTRPVQEGEAIAELEQIATQHDRLFALFWGEAESDPERVVERWLDAHAHKAADEWWGDVRLVTYAVPAAPATEVDVPLDARFGDEIALQGYALLEDRLAPADILQVTLFWEALEFVPERYKVFLHLLDSEGQLIAQHDSEPGGGLALTTTWQPGQVMIDNHGVLIPAETPEGTYRLIVGLYPLGEPDARLSLTLDGQPAGDFLWLSSIFVVQS